MKIFKSKLQLGLLAFLALSVFSCQDEVIVVDPVGDYNTNPDAYYVGEDAIKNTLNLPLDGPLDYSINTNNSINNFALHNFSEINNDIATLGRVLFYDTQLSKTNKVSCASCHKQDKAFSDDVAFSEGFAGERTERNSLALGAFVSIQQHYDDPTGNNPITPSFFWDERVETMHEQMIETIANEKEMGMEMHEVVERLNSESNVHYRSLFHRAFGDIEIDSEKILLAIETFMNSIVSINSKFDLEIAQNQNGFEVGNFQGFTDAENLGKELFINKCGSCHSSTLGSVSFANFNPSLGPLDQTKANSGLDMVYSDKGIGALTGNTQENGVFKIPQLRNVALTGPYMHDGRFETLEDVIDFYSENIQNHANLDPRLKTPNGQAVKMNFSQNDKEALVAFLGTLTDEVFIAEEKYSDPFIK